MKIYKKVLSIVLCTVLLTYVPLLKYTHVVAYADSITAHEPLLMPLAPWLGLVAIGTGIIGKNAADSATQLIQNASNNLKQKELEKINNDESYDSPFRVIQGGSDKTPQKPNNNNKNGAWFALGAGSALSSAMLFEKGAAETAMQTLQELNAYKKYITENGKKDINDVYNQSSGSNIALQLANISNTAVGQFDAFLHSDFFESQGLDSSNCFYNVSVDVNAVNNGNYPTMFINVFEKNEDIASLYVSSNPFSYVTYNGFSGYQASSYSGYDTAKFRNKYDVDVNVKWVRVRCNSRNNNTDLSYSVTGSSNTNNIYRVAPWQGSGISTFYSGYKWTVENPWGLTDNIYNVNQTFNVNFPNWEQGIMDILGKQLEGINIGGITSPISSPTWDPTQAQIQGGTVPQNVITQYINNYQNPESIPDDELNPDPDPDPDPDPEPVPDPEPMPDDNFLNGFMLPTAITNKFPFCIPFDVARALRLFSTSQREAPRWECDLHYGANVYHLVIDLSQFNDVAAFVRQLEFILFVVGLAVGTRNLIRG